MERDQKYDLHALKALAKRVEQQIAQDYITYKISENFNWSRVQGLSGKTIYSLSYIMVRHPLVYNFLINHFRPQFTASHPIAKIYPTRQEFYEPEEEVYSLLADKVSDDFIYKAIDYLKNKKGNFKKKFQTKNDGILYYFLQPKPEGAVNYTGYYFSNKKKDTKTFSAKLAFRSNRFSIENFHGNPSLHYRGDIIIGTDTIYLEGQRREKEIEGIEKITLWVNRSRYSVEKMNVMHGSMLCRSENGEEIVNCEFFLLRSPFLKDGKMMLKNLRLYVSQHLRIHHNSYRLPRGNFLVEPAYYEDRYKFRLNFLERLVGNHVVAFEQGVKQMAIAKLVIKRNYKATLYYRGFKGSKNCTALFSVGQVVRNQALQMQVVFQQQETPFMFCMFNVEEQRQFASIQQLEQVGLPVKDVIFGSFCNLIDGNAQGGKILILTDCDLLSRETKEVDLQQDTTLQEQMMEMLLREGNSNQAK